MKRPVLLGTENKAKQERLAWLLEGPGLAWATPEQMPLKPPHVPEEGPSHQANAQAKALAWSGAYGGMAIASDGGLVIPALGWRWDSLRTRRFAKSDDAQRAHELLAIMEPLAAADRRAYWVEAVALAERGRILHTFSAQSGEGYIALDVREDLIKDGFWMGAVWYFPQLNKLYAQLTEDEQRHAGDHWTALRAKVQTALG